MPILNYTTSIDAHKTVTELQMLLSKKGARKVLLEYNEQGQPTALMFEILLNGESLQYRLPCRHRQVHKILLNERSVERRYKTEQHALKVGWRIIKTWIEAQFALVESQQAEMAEVFFPYALTKSGETVYEQIVRTRYLLEDKGE